MLASITDKCNTKIWSCSSVTLGGVSSLWDVRAGSTPQQAGSRGATVNRKEPNSASCTCALLWLHARHQVEGGVCLVQWGCMAMRCSRLCYKPGVNGVLKDCRALKSTTKRCLSSRVISMLTLKALACCGTVQYLNHVQINSYLLSDLKYGCRCSRRVKLTGHRGEQMHHQTLGEEEGTASALYCQVIY